MCCSGLLIVYYVALGVYGYADDSQSLVQHRISVPVDSSWHVRIWNVPSCFGTSTVPRRSRIAPTHTVDSDDDLQYACGSKRANIKACAEPLRPGGDLQKLAWEQLGLQISRKVAATAC